ncbi:MAG: FapA family protein [Fibromonadales bacterium]|nr:FapA family protein [Fibromonadales bacterium]
MAILDNTNIQESFKWLLWRIDSTGTYLTVVPNLVPQKWDINEIKKTLLKGEIVNFDIAKIEKTIKNASGQEELIGPPFEEFEDGKRRYLSLQVTPIQARFAMDTAILQTDYRVTAADISFLLEEKAVIYGIDHETIEEILSKGIYGSEFTIANATPPIAGKDAVIEEVLPIDPDVKPFLDEYGTADYKTWDNIRQIKEGEVICTRIPPTPGIPGTSVFGHPLSPTPGEDFALPGGANTKPIDDETKLVASINGFLYRDGRNICVGGVYIIKGDVDFKTGNIEYFGDVLVRGNVTAGFSVVADGNVSIEGYIEAAHIESKTGNVFLKGSVFGQNKAVVIAEKNINADNVQDCTLKAGQTIAVKGQIRNCKVETKNLEMPMGGQIISSSVGFSGHLKCGSIGGKAEAINEFTLIESDRQLFKEELQGINDLLQKLNQAIELLLAKIGTIKPSDTSPEMVNQRKLLGSKLDACNHSKEQLMEKRKKLVKLLEIMPDKDALITAYMLMPTLKVSIYGSTKEFKQELSHLKIGWKSGGIKMESN